MKWPKQNLWWFLQVLFNRNLKCILYISHFWAMLDMFFPSMLKIIIEYLHLCFIFSDTFQLYLKTDPQKIVYMYMFKHFTFHLTSLAWVRKEQTLSTSKSDTVAICLSCTSLFSLASFSWCSWLMITPIFPDLKTKKRAYTEYK